MSREAVPVNAPRLPPNLEAVELARRLVKQRFGFPDGIFGVREHDDMANATVFEEKSAHKEPPLPSRSFFAAFA